MLWRIVAWIEKEKYANKKRAKQLKYCSMLWGFNQMESYIHPLLGGFNSIYLQNPQKEGCIWLPHKSSVIKSILKLYALPRKNYKFRIQFRRVFLGSGFDGRKWGFERPSPKQPLYVYAVFIYAIYIHFGAGKSESSQREIFIITVFLNVRDL